LPFHRNKKTLIEIIKTSEAGIMRAIKILALTIALAGYFAIALLAQTEPALAGGGVATAVGPQYDTTHVYVAPEDFDRFVTSLIATFGGTTSRRVVFRATPTPSQTMSQLVLTPVGSFSIFGYKTPIPFPFGAERLGYLVTDLDAALASAKSHGADTIVAPYLDPIGRDAIIEWPGGLHMQLYSHSAKPNYPELKTVPESHVYVSADRSEAFVTSFNEFAQGKVISDDRAAPGVEIGRPNEPFRRIRIESPFGKLTVIVTDGQLPYPYGREATAYEVEDLGATITKAEAAGVTVLVKPYIADQRKIAIVQFPGGYVAEIHALAGK
jgi:hypothetical protein